MIAEKETVNIFDSKPPAGTVIGKVETQLIHELYEAEDLVEAHRNMLSNPNTSSPIQFLEAKRYYRQLWLAIHRFLDIPYIWGIELDPETGTAYIAT